MSLTKTEIIVCIQEKLGDRSQKQIQEYVEVLLEVIKSTLENGEDVLISNFGKFTVKDKSARKGRNPATNKSILLPERRVVTFKSSKNLRNKLNMVK
jgi:integration host factor subunit alpha